LGIGDVEQELVLDRRAAASWSLRSELTEQGFPWIVG
jgi:hypothetical protein